VEGKPADHIGVVIQRNTTTKLIEQKNNNAVQKMTQKTKIEQYNLTSIVLFIEVPVPSKESGQSCTMSMQIDVHFSLFV
jgi:uncharacterized membrane protein